MNELIECRECTSPRCRGCNIYILSSALQDGKFDSFMNENHLISVPNDATHTRHGRWKLEENWDTGFGVYVHVCTACNAITPVNVSRYRYCPNCGAKMDGDDG